jgi:ABC-2 type transport system permease protein
LCAFVLEEVSPLDWMYQKLVFTIGGMFIPLDVFPDSVDPNFMVWEGR